MTKYKPAESHTSKVLSDLLKGITPEEQARTDKKMLLAMKLDEAIKAKGWTNKRFAEEMNQHASVISKWLSGSHNFTADTLWDIESKLNIELISLVERTWKVTRVVEYKIVVQGINFLPHSFAPSYHALQDSQITLLEPQHAKYG